MRAGQLTMALRNLSRNKRRNFATGAAIAAGFAALIALGGFVNRMENYLRVYTIYATRVGHINIYKEHGFERFSTKPKLYSLDEHELRTIQDIVSTMDNVEMHGAQIVGMGIIGNGCRTVPFIANGIDPSIDLLLRNHDQMRKWMPKLRDFDKGRGLWNYDESQGAIALSNGLARLLGKTRVFDELPKDQKSVVVVDCSAPDAKEKISADTNVQLVAGGWSGMMAALDGEVVANFASAVTETNNSAILTSLKLLQKLYDTQNATFYSLWLKNPKELSANMATLKGKLAAAGLKAELYPWMDESVAPFYTGTMQFIYVMVGFISFVLAAVVILSIFNSATMTIIERSQEIGMMRSLGFTRRQIRQLFVAEMVFLSGISVVCGGIVAAVGVFIVNSLGVPYKAPGIAGHMTLQLTPNFTIVSTSAALTLGLAILTTLIAVWSVAKTNIATLLLGSQR